MKLGLILSLICFSFSALAVDPVRDLTRFPLNKNENIAFRAAQSLARELGQKLRPECVNASMGPGTEPVSVQFYYDEVDGKGCVDPHYSIEVELDSNGKVLNITLIDA